MTGLPEKIQVNIDTVAFAEKPKGNETISAICKRLGEAWNRIDIAPRDLAARIENGMTITPARLNGTKGESWQSQQIIAADVDNELKDGSKIDNPLQPSEALAALQQHGLTPWLMYFSFSSAPGWPRYRILFILDKPLKDPAKAAEYTKKLAFLLNSARESCADTVIFNPARMLFGCAKGGIICQNNESVEAAQFDALPLPDGEPDAQAPAAPADRQQASAADYPPPLLNGETIPESVARAIVKSSIPCGDYLTKSAHGNYICPFCGSGTGPNQSGAVKWYKETNTWACHACTKENGKQRAGDVIDLYCKQKSLPYFAGLCDLAKLAGITARIIPDENGGENLTAELPESSKTQEPMADFTPYYEYCRKLFDESQAAQAYVISRGISLETARLAKFGFDPQADPANAPGAMADEFRPHPCPRIIIAATGHSYYIGRSINPNTSAAYKVMVPGNSKGAVKPNIFRSRNAVNESTAAIFVTEGIFDALSITEVLGKEVAIIALNSANNGNLLIEFVKQQRTKATLLLCLDNDKAGQEATTRLQAELEKLGASCKAVDICCGKKDPNEALMADRAAFEKACRAALNVLANEARADNTTAYIDSLMSGEIEKFKQARDRKTGFANLDELAGGLNAGLYILAAMSSLGKTTFALQIADQMAAAGHDIIFYSMEQSRLELVSKSLARLTAQADMKTAVDSLSIRRGYLPHSVLAAAQQYKELVKDRITIKEGNFRIDTDSVKSYVTKYKQLTGSTPIVIIDYLQILQAGGNIARGKREEIDLVLTDIRQLSRDLDIPIIAISSLNRSNYMQKFSFEALKESGQIEYTADVVWGLQLACLDEALFSQAQQTKIDEKRARVDAAMDETPRKVKLVCLKNRYGKARFFTYFDYYPKFDLFVPALESSKKPARIL